MKQINWGILLVMLLLIIFWLSIGSCVYSCSERISHPTVTCSCMPVTEKLWINPNTGNLWFGRFPSDPNFIAVETTLGDS